MTIQAIVTYIKANLSVTGVLAANINIIIPEEGEEGNKSFPDYPAIEIVEGDGTSELHTSEQTRTTTPVEINLYTNAETQTQINAKVQDIKDFFRDNHNLGGTAILVSDVEISRTISTDGEMQMTPVIASILYNESYS